MSGVGKAAIVGSDADLRDRVSTMHGLLTLSMVMTESGDEQAILHLATTAVPSLGQAHLDGMFLTDGGWRLTRGPCTDADVRADVEAQFAVLEVVGGAVTITGEGWGWAYPLRGLEGHFGFLLVGGEEPPDTYEQFLLRVLAQQTGIALADARMHARARAVADELRATSAALAATVAAAELSTAIHDRLTQVAFAGEGQEGIARAVHELTGYPVAVEDRYGNLRAWAGPARPDPYPKDEPAAREELLHRAQQAGRPIREGARLLALAHPGGIVLGVLVLYDEEETAGAQGLAALEHGATVLAMDLARLHSLAESELRMTRDLVEELLAGTDAEHSVALAQALGYELQRPHRVLVVDSPGGIQEEGALLHAVRLAAQDMEAGSLLAPRSQSVVVLSPLDKSAPAAGMDGPWEQLRAAIRLQLGGRTCRIGVGGRCAGPADFPRSYREAQLALTMQSAAGGDDRVTAFDQLGVYRILAEAQDTGTIERFVAEWLGPLLAYDAEKQTELVPTLSRYLENGGGYEATARALAVHRSTLKYRLQRIREIAGVDLADPETLFCLQLATRARDTLATLRGTPS